MEWILNSEGNTHDTANLEEDVPARCFCFSFYVSEMEGEDLISFPLGYNDYNVVGIFI